MCKFKNQKIEVMGMGMGMGMGFYLHVLRPGGCIF